MYHAKVGAIRKLETNMEHGIQYVSIFLFYLKLFQTKLKQRNKKNADLKLNVGKVVKDK
jgi:hypothetical protein